MNRLIWFEFVKLWMKRSFLVLMAVLVSVNLFLLWYVNQSDGTEPELSAYKAVQNDMRAMTEEEKRTYIRTLYQDIEGIRVVQDILQFQGMQNEMGRELARQEMEQHPGIFERYRDAYEDGRYLKYTGSFEQEKSLIEEIYEESEKVYSYSDYLAQIRENKDTLQGISIFADKAEGEDFSSRNITKSTEDYENLDSVEILYYPSKGIASAMDNDVSDVLLFLAVFLFAGGAVYEERQKRLHLVIRATVCGRGRSITARLAALGIHCVVVTALIYGINLIYFAGTAGLGNLFRSIQSVAPYMESSLPINVFSFLLLSLLTKAGALYLAGLFIMLVAVLSRQSFMPYLMGAVYLAVNLLLYWLIPAWSSLNWLKYLTIFGMLKTGDIYGGYLNFNLAGYPFSRTVVSPCVLAGWILPGMFVVAAAYMRSGEWESLPRLRRRRFCPHGNLFRHEGYKILVMNRVLLILLLFVLLLGYRRMERHYGLSATESYYQAMMLQLEGEDTPEKKTIVEKEKARYEELFKKIQQIDEMTERGEIREETSESMKAPYYSELIFYPSFQRVLQQYDNVKEGGQYIYDTGYLYLLGIREDDVQMDLLLLSLCMILAFSNVMAMEEEKKLWPMLSATAQGRHSIVKHKLLTAVLCAVLTGVVPFVCRCIRLQDSYPLHGWGTSVKDIPACFGSGISMPLFLWVAVTVLLQIGSVVFVTLAVCWLSDRMKQHRQALFTGILILLLPLVLKRMGFSFAGWFSLYPLYAVSELLLREHGRILIFGYAAGVTVVTVIFMRGLCRSVTIPGGIWYGKR